MLEKIQALQIGDKDWNKIYRVPEEVELCYVDRVDEPFEQPFDLVFLDRAPGEREVDYIHRAAKAYTLFVTEHVELAGKAVWLYESRKGRRLREAEVGDFLLHEAPNYFPKSYGEKISLRDLTVARGFSGSVTWNGGYSVCLEGSFGERLRQAVWWRTNIPVYRGQCLDLWLEYEKDETVSIALTVTLFALGSICEVAEKWEFSQEELERGIQLDNRVADGVASLSLSARGEGRLQVIALHSRRSRRGHGVFLPGGRRHVTSGREEIFSYFDPGDMRPPLNVYFSGYKTVEGFEGYSMMRQTGAPFLLVSEARLEGGSFYMGTEEYETMLRDMIFGYMEELGFTSDQVILSGISMGGFGALYYGCDIKPHGIVVGKPLLSIGDVAANGRLHRPGVFDTSFDILKYLGGDVSQEAVKRLNRHFWNKFYGTDWGQTKIIVSYMIEDDYDATAYQGLITHIRWDRVELYGKGFHGRHNDNSRGTVNWFYGQMRQILKQDFQRKVDGQR